jgi:hypothetical protein
MLYVLFVWFGMKYFLVVSHVMCSVCILSRSGENKFGDGGEGIVMIVLG